tara:strand:- start:1286 stop:1843 length:558 start_codon:yes stop_codon:yes gene_type:complete
MNELLNIIFPSSFFIQFKVPNADEFNLFLDNDDNKEKTKYGWTNCCRVETFKLDPKKYLPILKPSLEIFVKEIGKSATINIPDMWLNEYGMGGFQEMHDHSLNDFACVYFVNDGNNFSNFSFYDRNKTNLSINCRTILDYPSEWSPDISAGDIIFFPGHLLHYVSPHNSDIIRKSVSFNFDLGSK